MRIGINKSIAHDSPEAWAKWLHDRGYRAAKLPGSYQIDLKLADEYVAAAEAYDICIAEVGVWNNPNNPDPELAARAVAEQKEALAFADYVGARCCVNISGAAGPQWNALYAENYAPETYDRCVEVIRDLIDSVKPTRTYFVYEPMQWMIPDSPEQYLQLIRDVDRERFAVHMDASNWLYSPQTFLDYEGIVDRSFDLLGPWIKSCHLKDADLERELFSFAIYERPLGEGILSIRHYIDRIEALDPDMPVLFEHWKTMEEFDRCLEWCKREIPELMVR